SSSAMDSCLAASMKAHVLTSTTPASPASPSPASVQPPASSRPASSSESTSLRAQPRVTRLTVRSTACGFPLLVGTPADYGKRGRAAATAWPSARCLAGQLLAWPEAERHRLPGRAGPAQLLAVHGQQDPARITDLHGHRVVERPCLAAPPDHVVLGQVRPARGGEFHPA